jgi:uncharacterized membrane protein
MEHLVIDWAHSPTYTTIMGIFAGASLLSVANVGKKLLKKELNPVGWALNFGVLGVVLLLTGGAMVLTWPMHAQPFDNMIFGETSLPLGILDIGLAIYFWKRMAILEQSDSPSSTFSKDLAPFRTLLTGLGIGIISIACGAYRYPIFIAPKEEPFTGDFAVKFPILENALITTMFLGVGIAALLTVVCLRDFSKGRAKTCWYHTVNYLMLQLTGLYFLISSGLIYYTHIGLIVSTMK